MEYTKLRKEGGRRGISPVVASAILMVVAVISVLGFQTWFTSYSSEIFTQVGSQSISSQNVEIHRVVGGDLLVSSSSSSNISDVVLSIGLYSCGSFNLSFGMNSLDVRECYTLSGGGVQEIVLRSNNGIVSRTLNLPTNIGPFFDSCTLDGITRSHGQSYTFYNVTSTSVYSDLCSSYSQSRTCDNGTWSGDLEFEYATCTSPMQQDISPNPFWFDNLTNVNSGILYETDNITPSGFEGTISVSVSGDGSPELRVDGGDWVTSDQITLGENI